MSLERDQGPASLEGDQGPVSLEGDQGPVSPVDCVYLWYSSVLLKINWGGQKAPNFVSFHAVFLTKRTSYHSTMQSKKLEGWSDRLVKIS